jgi:hypothetical protein
MRPGISRVSNVNEKLYDYAPRMRHGFLGSIELI